MRFSFTEGNELDTLPDLICAVDSVMEEDLVSVGVPKNRIAITGSPHFERLRSIKTRFKKQGRSFFRKKFGFKDDEIVVIFLSQPIKMDFGKDKFGFDEEIILNDVIRAIKCQDWVRKARVIWKPHPREKSKRFEQRFPSTPFSFSEFSDGDIMELMAGSDLVIGVFTMLLIEALLLGFCSVSYQPNKKTFLKLPFKIKILKDYESLSKFFASKEFLGLQDNRTDKLVLDINSTEIIKNLIFRNSKSK